MIARLKNIIKTLIGYRASEHIRVPYPMVRWTMKQALEQLRSFGFIPDTVIDVGTARGTFPILEVFPEVNYLWLEPLSEFEPALKDLEKKYKGKYLLAAAGKSNGTVKINVHDVLEGSSVLKESDGPSVDGKEREVRLVILDSLINEYNLKNKLLLKIDVQGAEIDVMEGAKELLNYCEAIVLEVSFFKFLNDNPEFYEIVSYMKSKGFVAYDIFDGCLRPLDKALAQKDILFVKENGIFRRSHNWEIENMG